jgi:hypothetical protein
MSTMKLFTQAAFLSDPKAVMDAALDGEVAVTDLDGNARLIICRTLPPMFEVCERCAGTCHPPSGPDWCDCETPLRPEWRRAP